MPQAIVKDRPENPKAGRNLTGSLHLVVFKLHLQDPETSMEPLGAPASPASTNALPTWLYSSGYLVSMHPKGFQGLNATMQNSCFRSTPLSFG